MMGGMDSDTDERLVKPEDYIDAENIRITSDKQGKTGVIKSIPSNQKIKDTTYTVQENGSYQSGIGDDLGIHYSAGLDLNNWRITSSAQDMITDPNSQVFSYISPPVAQQIFGDDFGSYGGFFGVSGAFVMGPVMNQWVYGQDVPLGEGQASAAVLFDVWLPYGINNISNGLNFDSIGNISVLNSFLKINPDFNNQIANQVGEDGEEYSEAQVLDAVITSYNRVFSNSDLLASKAGYQILYNEPNPLGTEVGTVIRFARRLVFNGFFEAGFDNVDYFWNFQAVNTYQDLTPFLNEGQNNIIQVDYQKSPILCIKPDNGFGIKSNKGLTTQSVNEKWPCWLWKYDKGSLGTISYSLPQATPDNANVNIDNGYYVTVESEDNVNNGYQLLPANFYGVAEFMDGEEGNDWVNQIKYGILRQVLVKPALMNGLFSLTLGKMSGNLGSSDPRNFCDNFTVMGNCVDNKTNKIYYFVTGDLPSGGQYALPAPTKLNSPQNYMLNNYDFDTGPVTWDNLYFEDWQKKYPDLVNADIYTIDTLIQVDTDDIENEVSLQNTFARTGYYDKDFIIEYDPNFEDLSLAESVSGNKGAIKVILVDGLEVVSAVPNDNNWSDFNIIANDLQGFEMSCVQYNYIHISGPSQAITYTNCSGDNVSTMLNQGQKLSICVQSGTTPFPSVSLVGANTQFSVQSGNNPDCGSPVSPVGNLFDYDALPSYTVTWAHKKILNFNKKHPIKANVVDGMLYWTDGYSPPKKININKASIYSENVRRWTYTNPDFFKNIHQLGGFGNSINLGQVKLVNTLKLQHVEAIKYAPTDPPKLLYEQDTERSKNNVKQKCFQFKYRYVYEDNEVSAFSPESKLGRNWIDDYDSQESDALNLYSNRINISINRGDPSTVKAIEIAVKEVDQYNSGAYYLATNLDFDPNKNGIYVDVSVQGIDNLASYDSTTNTINYKFYNDHLLSSIPEIENESLFDNVPLIAKTQEFVGDRIIYSNTTEGFDKVAINASVFPHYNEAQIGTGDDIQCFPELLNIKVNGFSNGVAVGDNYWSNYLNFEDEDELENPNELSSMFLEGQNLMDWFAETSTYNSLLPYTVNNPFPGYDETETFTLEDDTVSPGNVVTEYQPVALPGYPMYNYGNAVGYYEPSQLENLGYTLPYGNVNFDPEQQQVPGSHFSKKMLGCVKLNLANSSYGPTQNSNINLSDNIQSLLGVQSEDSGPLTIQYSMNYRLYYRSGLIEQWGTWNAGSFTNNGTPLLPEGFSGNYLFTVEESVSGSVTYNGEPTQDDFLNFLVQHLNNESGGIKRIFSRINPVNLNLGNTDSSYYDNDIYMYINMGKNGVSMSSSELNQVSYQWQTLEEITYDGTTGGADSLFGGPSVEVPGGYEYNQNMAYSEEASNYGFAGISFNDADGETGPKRSFFKFKKGVISEGSFKSGAHHKFGLVYYDRANRCSPVITKNSLHPYVKFYSERNKATGVFENSINEGLGSVHMKWNITHKPPRWATHYQWVYSKNRTVKEFIQLPIWAILKSIPKEPNALSVYNQGDLPAPTSPGTTKSLYFHLGSFKNGNMYGLDNKLFSGTSLQERCPLVDYEFMEGDRIRFIASSPKVGQPNNFGKTSNGTVPPVYYDFKIKSVRNYHWKNIQHGHNRYETGVGAGDGANIVKHKVDNMDIWCMNEKWDTTRQIKDSDSPFYTILNCGWVVEVEDPNLNQDHIFPENVNGEDSVAVNYSVRWADIKDRDYNYYANSSYDSYTSKPHQNAWSQSWNNDRSDEGLLSNSFVEIYRPNKSTEKDKSIFYYEIGEKYDIGFPGRDERYHKGQLSDQDFDNANMSIGATGIFTQGDVYLKTTFFNLPDPIIGRFLNTDNNSTFEIIPTDEVLNFMSDSIQSYDNNLSDPNLLPADQQTHYYDIDYQALVDASGNPILDGDGNAMASSERALTANYNWDTYSRNFLVETYFYNEYFRSDACDIGRPNIVDDKSKRNTFTSKLIHSLPYNYENKVNGLNSFPFTAQYSPELVLDNKYGSICGVVGKDTDILVFQQDRITQILVNKNIISTADGGGQVSISSQFLGQPTAIPGLVGCSNGESIVKVNNDVYFVDKDRRRVYAITQQGIIDISAIGMKKKFMEELGVREIQVQTPFGPTTSIAKGSRIYGHYDPVAEEYIVTILYLIYSDIPKDNAISYNEEDLDCSFTYGDKRNYAFNVSSKRWITKYSFSPESYGVYLDNKFYTPKKGYLWLHNEVEDLCNKFYEDYHPSTITFSHNENPSNVKVYNAISLEAEQDSVNSWRVTNMTTNINNAGLSSFAFGGSFRKKEGEYFLSLPRTNAIANSNLIYSAGQWTEDYNDSDMWKSKNFRGVGRVTFYAPLTEEQENHYIVVKNELADLFYLSDTIILVGEVGDVATDEDGDTEDVSQMVYYDGHTVVEKIKANEFDWEGTEVGQIMYDETLTLQQKYGEDSSYTVINIGVNAPPIGTFFLLLMSISMGEKITGNYNIVTLSTYVDQSSVKKLFAVNFDITDSKLHNK